MGQDEEMYNEIFLERFECENIVYLQGKKHVNKDIYYLMEIDTATQNDFINKLIGNGDYFIGYAIKTNDPYSDMNCYYMHIIPENDYFVFENLLYSVYNFDGNPANVELNFKWILSGNSKNKNSLETKIYEYYINKKGDNILKKQAPADTKEIFEINGAAYYLLDIYINTIIKISYDNLPVKNYRGKFIIVYEDITYLHISAYYYNEDGKEIYFDPHTEYFPFFNLQEATYDHNRGNWWQCIIIVNNNGKYLVEYNYDVPEWVQEIRENNIK
jgi:hypothetical protein